SLSDLLNRCAQSGRHLPDQQVLRIFADICSAVAQLHLRRPPVQHRDLKAENVLAASDDPDCAFVLCDFGSASLRRLIGYALRPEPGDRPDIRQLSGLACRLAGRQCDIPAGTEVSCHIVVLFVAEVSCHIVVLFVAEVSCHIVVLFVAEVSCHIVVLFVAEVSCHIVVLFVPEVSCHNVVFSGAEVSCHIVVLFVAEVSCHIVVLFVPEVSCHNVVFSGAEVSCHIVVLFVAEVSCHIVVLFVPEVSCHNVVFSGAEVSCHIVVLFVAEVSCHIVVLFVPEVSCHNVVFSGAEVSCHIVVLFVAEVSCHIVVLFVPEVSCHNVVFSGAEVSCHNSQPKQLQPVGVARASSVSLKPAAGSTAPSCARQRPRPGNAGLQTPPLPPPQQQQPPPHHPTVDLLTVGGANPLIRHRRLVSDTSALMLRPPTAVPSSSASPLFGNPAQPAADWQTRQRGVSLEKLSTPATAPPTDLLVDLDAPSSTDASGVVSAHRNSSASGWAADAGLFATPSPAAAPLEDSAFGDECLGAKAAAASNTDSVIVSASTTASTSAVSCSCSNSSRIMRQSQEAASLMSTSLSSSGYGSVGTSRSSGSERRGFETRQLVNLCLVCLINLLERSVYYFFSVDTATDFTADRSNLTNSSSGPGAPPDPGVGDLGCNLFDTRKAKAIEPGSLVQFNSRFFVNGVGYLLPVLGGVLADAWLGCKRTLVAGSGLYLTGSLLFYIMLRLPACHQYLQLLSLAAMSGAVGFCKPSVAVLTAAYCRPRLGFAATFLIYYLCMSAGECLGCVLSFVESVSRKPLFAYCPAAAAGMLLLALLLEDRRSVVAYEAPTKRRMMLHFSQSSTFIACIALSLTSFYLYGYELSSYLSCPTRLDEQIHLTQLWTVYSFAMLLTCGLLLAGVRWSAWLREPESRICLGLAVYAASQVAAVAANLTSNSMQVSGQASLFLIMSVPTVLTAAAEALTIAAGYELTYRSAKLGCKAFITGVYITVWGLGFFFMALLLLLFTRFPAAGPWLSSDIAQVGSQVHWAHLLLAGLLLLNLLAFQCGCRPVAGAIQCEDDRDVSSHFEPAEAAAAAVAAATASWDTVQDIQDKRRRRPRKFAGNSAE
uniref:Protein kinase domain-containing protein n=1 Tax=Macrostomum lignano TaxID=282301 RepID=A0A1I8G0G1_9PLAT